MLETLEGTHEHSWDLAATVASCIERRWDGFVVVGCEAALAAAHIAAAVAAVCLCRASADTLSRTVALASAAFLHSHWKVAQAVVLNFDNHHCSCLDIQATVGLWLVSYLVRHILGRTVDRTADHSLGCTMVASTRRIALDIDCHAHFE